MEKPEFFLMVAAIAALAGATNFRLALGCCRRVAGITRRAAQLQVPRLLLTRV